MNTTTPTIIDRIEHEGSAALLDTWLDAMRDGTDLDGTELKAIALNFGFGTRALRDTILIATVSEDVTDDELRILISRPRTPEARDITNRRLNEAFHNEPGPRVRRRGDWARRQLERAAEPWLRDELEDRRAVGTQPLAAAAYVAWFAQRDPVTAGEQALRVLSIDEHNTLARIIISLITQ